MLLGGKVYPRIKYFIVVLIVVGVALFFYKDGGGDPGAGQAKLFNLVGFGEALIVSQRIRDGLGIELTIVAVRTSLSAV